MKNKDLDKANAQQAQSRKDNGNNLEWGAHNPKLRADNFIDRHHQKISDQNELLANVNVPISSKKQK